MGDVLKIITLNGLEDQTNPQLVFRPKMKIQKKKNLRTETLVTVREQTVHIAQHF